MRWLYILDFQGAREMAIRFLSENPNRFSPSVKEWIKTLAESEDTKETSRQEEQSAEVSDDGAATAVAEIQLEIPESHLLALSVYLDNPKINVEELCEILDCKENQISDKAGVIKLLTKAAATLRERVEKEMADEQELNIWQKLETFFGDGEAIETFFEALGNSNEEQSSQTSVADSGVIPEGDYTTEVRPFVREIERRDPEVREKVRGIIEEVRSKNLDHFTQWQMQELFPDNIHMKMHIYPASRNGIIKLDKNPHGRNYHAVFSQLEAAVMIYYIRNLDKGYNLNAGLMDNVRKIIREEIRKMDGDESQNNGNGNSNNHH